MWNYHWSRNLERHHSLHLLLVGNRHCNLTLTLSEVRIEEVLELGLHLLHELLAELLDVGRSGGVSGSTATATTATAASAAPATPTTPSAVGVPV